MHTILDLDLDVFSSPTVHWPGKDCRPSDSHICASAEDVRHFLEQQCGLSRDSRIPGHEFCHHDEAFYTWRRWIEQRSLSPPFAIAHVDAHADMGEGDEGCVYLLSELLDLPVERRRDPRRASNALNAGNYLMFAVANRWVDRLTYVFPIRHPWLANWNSSPSKDFQQDPRNGVPDDLMDMHFQDGSSRALELRHCTKETFERCVGRSGPLEPAIHIEPAVPFEFTPVPEFGFRGFTHIVVAHSPQYTAPSAYNLLPVIREYFIAC
jgi:hypothetical protein